MLDIRFGITGNWKHQDAEKCAGFSVAIFHAVDKSDAIFYAAGQYLNPALSRQQ